MDANHAVQCGYSLKVWCECSGFESRSSPIVHFLFDYDISKLFGSQIGPRKDSTLLGANRKNRLCGYAVTSHTRPVLRNVVVPQKRIVCTLECYRSKKI